VADFVITWIDYPTQIDSEELDLLDLGFGTFSDFPYSSGYLTKIFIIDHDVIRLFFSELLSVDRALQNISNFILSPTSATIQSIRGSYGATTLFVDFYVLGLTDGMEYEIGHHEDTLRDADGLFLTPTKVPWTYTLTKVEMTKSSLAQMYDLTLESHLRGIVQAIMVSDEEIGGSQENRVIESPGLPV